MDHCQENPTPNLQPCDIKRDISLKETLKFTLILPAIGVCVTFPFVYIMLLFYRLVLPFDAIDPSVSIYSYPLKPLLLWTLPFGYPLGVMTYRTPAKTAAIWASILFSVVYTIFTLFIVLYYHEYKFEPIMVYCLVIMASMGACLGGMLSIINASVFLKCWPRFILAELFIGFSLVTAILGCLTAIARQPY
jgi:hypothetical protein